MTKTLFTVIEDLYKLTRCMPSQLQIFLDQHSSHFIYNRKKLSFVYINNFIIH